MSEYLFVYGTLLPGTAPAEIATAASQLRAIDHGTVQGTLYDLGDFPGAVLESVSGRRIFGTVFALPENPEVLRELDAYEEFDPAAPGQSQFLRVRAVARLVSGAKRDCWIYIYNQGLAKARIIEGGDWTRRDA